MGFLSKLFGGPPPQHIVGPELHALTPENDLEELLCAAREGRGSIEDFVERMLESQIFMPSTAEAEVPNGAGKGFRPIIAEVQSDNLVVACTSADRTSTLIGVEIRSGMLVEAQWVLRMLGDGLGLWINPGWDAGLLMPSEGMRRFRIARGLV